MIQKRIKQRLKIFLSKLKNNKNVVLHMLSGYYMTTD